MNSNRASPSRAAWLLHRPAGGERAGGEEHFVFPVGNVLIVLHDRLLGDGNQGFPSHSEGGVTPAQAAIVGAMSRMLMGRLISPLEDQDQP